MKAPADAKLSKAQEDFNRARARTAPVSAPAPKVVVEPKTTVVVAPKKVVLSHSAPSHASVRSVQKASTIIANCAANAKRPVGCVKRHIYSLEVRADEIGMNILKCQYALKNAKVANDLVIDGYVRSELTRLHAQTDVAYEKAHRGTSVSTMAARGEYLASVMTFLKGEQKLEQTVCSPSLFNQAIAARN